ncbi:acyl-CoA dehydrogenase family protein [Lentzea kentuckyensis]|uniref:acyl-CoA dehydrogenase family protein n=1 Tax=Lentzea kentuckyensis TaxID=360086 RepID=UPI000A3B52E3|nr:acyl-CoA dehydrogenase family protein [Lentzea kentuckyensis]
MSGFVEAAAGLRPVLERHQAAGDRDRRLTGEAMAALRDIGVFRMFVSAELGGLGLDLLTAVTATAELAKGDPSAAWVVMILGAGDQLAGRFPAHVQREIYGGGPDTHICTVLTPRAKAERVDGGWRLTGEWFPASGCLHATWALVGFPIGAEDQGVALVPLSELRIKDTWFTTGMRATGSNLMAGEDVFVPDERVLNTGEELVGDMPLLPSVLTFMISPYLGTARAALEHVVAQADKRPVSFTTYQRQSDSPAFQLAIAEAAAKIDVAGLLARSCAEMAGDASPDNLARARVRLHASHAVRQCGEALDLLVSAHGASAVAESSPLNVYLRDMQTALRHAMISPTMSLEAFGRVLLGVRPNITPLI